MKVGVFDSGLGGLTVVQAINKFFKGAEVFYIADTLFAPYGEKSKEQILKRSLDITNYLLKRYEIEALIVACNTATSAAINELRQKFEDLIVIGTEPGVKPAISKTKTKNIGVLATPATLNGEKYKDLVGRLSKDKELNVFETACVGLVDQIENGKIFDINTHDMLQKWLDPMKKQKVDTIVLGCTHYPLVSEVIKDIMGSNIELIETGEAIAKRLDYLCSKKGHCDKSKLKIKIFYTGKIKKDMVSMILEDWQDGGKIEIKEKNG